MKKFLNPEPGGGVPITNQLLYVLQSEPFTAALALYASIAPSWIVTGCNVTYNLGSSTCDITGGYVFLGGELREVDAITSVFPFYIIADTDTYESKQFGNGAVQNVFVNKKAIVSTVQPTSGSFLTVNPTITDDTVTKRIKPLLSGDILTQLNIEIQNRINGDANLNNSLVAETNSRINADNQLQANINNLTAVVNNKQNRVTSKLAWSDIVISNTYYTSTENTNDPKIYGGSGAIYNKFQIMRTEDGIVHVRGYLKGNGGGLIATVPVEFRPKNTVQYEKTYITNGNANYPGNVSTVHTIEIDPSGQVLHTQTMSQPISANDNGAFQLLGFHSWFLVDGLSYSVE